MATCRDIVQAAFRKIGVVASDEPMTADQAAEGMFALNMMMSALALEGIDVAWNEAELPDQFDMLPEFHEGLVYMLASRLSPNYSQPGFDDSAFKRGLAAAYLIIPDAKLDRALRRPYYRRGGRF
jgi:hypothetical protein